MDLTRRKLRVTIDALVLDGVEPRDRLVAQAVRLALEPRLQEHGTSPGTSARVAGTVARTIADTRSTGAES